MESLKYYARETLKRPKESSEGEHHSHRTDQEWRALVRGWVTRLKVENMYHSMGDLGKTLVEEMERESRPLIIRIPKQPHTTLDDEDDEDTDKRAQKRQRTKSSHSFISSEQSLYSEIVYTAFNDSGLAPENPKTLAEAKNGKRLSRQN